MPIDTNVTITPQNLVDYYKEFVVDVANSNIAWANNAEPFGEFDENLLSGTTAGRSIGISGSNVGSAGNLIDASDIYDVVLAETGNYTRIRNLRALLNVEGGGGNTGSRPTPGIVFDETRKAFMNTDYLQTLGSVSTGDVTSGNTITATSLETLFNALKTEYEAKQVNTVTIQVNVCHASCHSSCHGSRGRR
jgi:hypothetical protein